MHSRDVENRAAAEAPVLLTSSQTGPFGICLKAGAAAHPVVESVCAQAVGGRGADTPTVRSNQLRGEGQVAVPGREGLDMKLTLSIFLTMLALEGVAIGADRIVHYEHFTAAW